MKREPGSADRLGLVRSALPAIAILVLVACVYTYHQELRRLGHAAASLQQEASAHTIRGRLIGQSVGKLSLTALREDKPVVWENGAGLRVLWFVDPRSCVNCLNDFTSWRKLTRNPEVKNTLVLVGVSRARAARMVRKAGVRSTVWWDEAGSVASNLVGTSPPPSLIVLLGSDRTVLGAEIGYRRGKCDPEMFTRLAALIETIRKGEAEVYAGKDELAERSVEMNSQKGDIDATTDP